MSDDDIYQTDKYFGGKIILKGYKDPVTHQPTKEYVELREAFDRIANSKAGAELIARIATNLTDQGPRTIWATPQTAADANVLKSQDRVKHGSQAIIGPNSYHDTRSGSHDVQRFAGTSDVAVDLDAIDATPSTVPSMLQNVYYGVDHAYHQDAPDMIVFHELAHAILGTTDPSENRDSTPGATVRATNKYAIEKGYVPRAVYGKPAVGLSAGVLGPDQWSSEGARNAYLNGPDAKANVFPESSGTVLHKSDYLGPQLNDEPHLYPYSDANAVDLVRMLMQH
jgi:hypothetical protein